MTATLDDFWVLYPKRVAKGEARKAWNARIKDTPAETILDGLRAHLAAGTFEAMKANARRQGLQEKQFIPYPASWLRSEGWADELPTQSTRPMFTNGAMELLARDAEARWDAGNLLEGSAGD